MSAGFGIRMTTSGMEETRAYMAMVEKQFSSGLEIRQEFEIGSRLLLKDAQEFAPKDRGELRDSLDAEVAGIGADTVSLVYSPLERAVYSELGSRPHWPPIAALEGWALRHGFPAKGGAFLVARAISIHGTPAFYFMKRALEKNRAAIIRNVVKRVRDIIARMR